MRHIKFRAWDGVNMIYPDWLATHESGKYWQVKPNDNYDAEEYPLMQFTGLRDKNGKEIYEGDIVRWSGFGYQYTTQVSFFNGKFAPMADPSYEITIQKPSTAMVEIIGNIYENPELLK